jgi:hypothetical protein
MMTDFSKQVEILSDFWQSWRDDKRLADFFDFNDIGLPLAWLSSEGLCEINEDGKKYVAESWELFLATFGVDDKGFDNLGDVFAASGKTPDTWE